MRVKSNVLNKGLLGEFWLILINLSICLLCVKKGTFKEILVDSD